MKFLLLLICVTCTLLSQAQNPTSDFKSDVETDKKPWTNLNFQNNPDNFQFAIMADRTGGKRPNIFKKAVAKINTLMPEFVICVGDLIPGYTNDTAQTNIEWKEVNDIISGLEMPFFYLPGNHDITNKVMGEDWENRFGKRYYHFIYKNTLFITLDSNEDEEFNFSEKQTDFVLKTLKENQDVRWTFILMHHPVWNWDTDGRFEEIEEALKNREHSVFAGHTHRYNHSTKNNANYYILATTGGSSSLSGDYFGRFDHISWITLKDDGPVMANLKLDGILPHNITNDKISKMADVLQTNARLNHLVLCNKGKKFKHGTLYLSFENPTETDLGINLNFFHHQQLHFGNFEDELIVKAGKSKILEIPFTSSKPGEIENIHSLHFEWEMQYIDSEKYPRFELKGKKRIAVLPSESNFISNRINIFTKETSVGFENPFFNLETKFKLNNKGEKIYNSPINISNDSHFVFFLQNNRNEFTANENRSFSKSEIQESTEVSNLNSGLKYKYFEVEWETMPDFTQLEVKTKGVAHDFLVSDIALREDNWGLVYEGFIKIPEDNLYIFRTRANDACRFFINNKTVIDETTIIKGEHVGAAQLKKGFHPIRIDFWEKEGNQRLRFYYKNKEDGDWNFMEFDPFYYE